MSSIPSTWPELPLGEVAHVYSGGTPSRANPSYWGGSIPWVSTAEISDSEIRTTREWITPLGLERSSAKVARPGTLLMAMYGQGKTRGQTAILRISAAMNQACAAIEPRRTVDGAYLLHFLKYRYEDIRALSNSGGQANLSGGIVKKIPIMVPSVKEQQRIAEALADIACLVESLQHLIAKKQSIKQGMMQQLLTGRTRLPGFDRPWSESSVGELAQIVSGGTPKSSVSNYWDGGVAWCTPTDITRQKGRFLRTTERTISQEGLEHSAAQLLPVGSLLLCTRATIGEVKIATRPIATNQGFKSLVPRTRVSGEYLYYKILTLKGDLAAKGTGSTFLEVSKRDVAALTFEVPGYDEQIAIASALGDADDELTFLQKRLDKARSIKQGMMQELLTGRTHLPVEATS